MFVFNSYSKNESFELMILYLHITCQESHSAWFIKWQKREIIKRIIIFWKSELPPEIMKIVTFVIFGLHDLFLVNFT